MCDERRDGPWSVCCLVFIGPPVLEGEQTQVRLAQQRASDVRQDFMSRDKRTKRRCERSGGRAMNGPGPSPFKTNESWNAAVCLGARTIS